MALMPGLQLNIGQQLKLTPQLQQSIKILQYSALEVQQVIKTTLESNYMLETDDMEFDEEIEEDFKDDVDENVDLNNELDIENDQSLSEEIELDMSWNEVFSDHTSSSSGSASSDEFTSAENYTAAHTSLYDHLQWQAEIAFNPGYESVVASYIIDEINDEGFLIEPLTSILENIQNNESEITGISELTLEDIEAVLTVIQQFEPTGVAARNLQETLILQLNAQKQTPFVVTAKQLISENFEWLSFHDHKRIKKFYGLNDHELTTLLKLIQTLNPRPGREYADTEAEVVIPDLRLKRDVKNGWLVELNADAFPRLSVNSTYVDLVNKMSKSEDSKKMKEQLLEAKGLIKSVHSRGETLLRVGAFIIKRQKEFFEKGEEAMQPMVLREVADELDLHESTISRATNQKYIQTPRGTFELKYFFSTGIGQYGSADQSSTAIKAHIKNLIDNEDPKKPLSDNKLMALLEEKEINVARRTIAKYREALNIPSSSERKKLNKYKF
ncbi:RNA polymerase factor sigma-54 [Thiomicrorhabdus indica]|uniref:RNA polymerase factor sigma-54 n=1 Tax=Thiomicrorhabdus indica TaxID=2267253 RepID=UPI002AA7FF20|nr:RNA polymerase factor sigma-54 [Thiomicrorhabdus indica]